ncbi:MAG: ATP synthase F1 subunit epsilon [Patescibacteria group bacterium]|nr:ATP synthase F1 subunit epsilon [Patescibacteria group bacterium]
MATTAQLKVITPAKVVIDTEIVSVTVPSAVGELTIMPRHEHYFTLLEEGIVTIRVPGKEEDLLAIGGGYLETDGKQITILVSRAYGQDEINKTLTERAIEEAKKILENTKDQQERAKALVQLRRAELDLKVTGRRRRKVPAGSVSGQEE